MGQRAIAVCADPGSGGFPLSVLGAVDVCAPHPGNVAASIRRAYEAGTLTRTPPGATGNAVILPLAVCMLALSLASARKQEEQVA